MDKNSVRNVVKVGIFFDGNYINHIAEFYAHRHSIRSRISLRGVQEFALQEISRILEIDAKQCKIVESHVYKSRVTAQSAKERDALYGERVFDDACMYDGITTHYLPIRGQHGSRRQQKGLDVWLSLDAYEMASSKNLDIVVLITSDSAFKPLISKIHGLNAQTLLLGWDISWDREDGREMVTKTSKDLISAANYYVRMDEVIETRSAESSVQNLFVEYNPNRTDDDFNDREFKESRPSFKPTSFRHRGERQQYRQMDVLPTKTEANHVTLDPENRLESEIRVKKNGFGFISYPPNNLYFHAKDMLEGDSFDDLEVNDAVEFQIGKNEKGEDVARCVRILWDEDDDSREESYQNEYDDQLED